MIDTYFDRASWPTWMTLKPQSPHWDDPRYFNHQLYMTMIDRNVAEAKVNVNAVIQNRAAWHRVEIQAGIKLGHPESVFKPDGTFKTIWTAK
jgi:hypothetical protein